MAHILLAEDDESLRKFLAAALVKAGHAVTDFGDGGDAWECVKGFTFDLLLTDIVMPGMDGIELAKRAVELNAALKIMFITGFAAVALHPASGAPKQAKVLSKPFVNQLKKLTKNTSKKKPRSRLNMNLVSKKRNFKLKPNKRS